MHTVPSIPPDQPFVTRARLGVQAALLGAVAVVAVVGSVLLVAVTAALQLPLVPFLAVLACPAAILAVAIGFQLWRMSEGSVLLAAGPTGLWIRSAAVPPVPASLRTPILYFRWDEIERISIVHWRLLDKRLVVTPRGTGSGSSTGRRLAHALYGDGYGVGISLADTSTAEVLNSLAYYSAGRCAVG